MASDAKAPERIFVHPRDWYVGIVERRELVEYIRADALPGTVEAIGELIGMAGVACQMLRGVDPAMWKNGNTYNGLDEGMVLSEQVIIGLEKALAALTAKEK